MPRVSASRLIPAPQGKVWSVLSDIGNARRWNRSWSRIEMTSTQTHGTGTSFRAHTEEGPVFDFVVSEWVAPEYIAFSPIHDEHERYEIMLESHAFRLQPAEDNHTLVELTAHASAHGIRGRLVALFFWPGHQKHGLEAALDALQSAFEPEPGGDEAVSHASPPGG